MADLTFFQIGLNTVEMAGTLRFFAEVFGFANAGGQAAWGETLKIQGVDPDSQVLCWFMVGRRRRLQLEIFRHTNPETRLQPSDWSPADHGWVRFGLAVSDFDGVLARLATRGLAPIAGTATTRGLRRFAVRAPYIGVIIEVWEDGPGLPGGPYPRDYDYDPLIFYVSSSVSDLAAAEHYYSNILGLELAPLETLHGEADEALWGLAGASRKGFVALGGDGLIEVVEYSAPRGRPKPEGWLLSDQGIMNIAFVGSSPEAIQRVIDRLDADGSPPEWLITGPGILGTYVKQRDREIEMLSLPDEFGKYLGYEPLGPFGASDVIQMVHRESSRPG